LALSVSWANADAVVFTFDSPGGIIVGHTAPLVGESVSHLTMDAVVNLFFETTVNGGSITAFPAAIEVDLEVGTVIAQPPFLVASVAGTVTFRDTRIPSQPDCVDSNVIVRGTADSGALIIVPPAGNVTLSNSPPGSLVWRPGPALAAQHPESIRFKGLEDGIFTLTNIAPNPTPFVVDGTAHFGEFLSNAAFSGSADLRACPGDFDDDRDTDIFDFGILAANFGTCASATTNGDLDANGHVNVIDFGLFAADFGCFDPELRITQ